MDRAITFLGSRRGKIAALGTAGLLFALLGVTFAQNALREGPAEEAAEANLAWTDEIQREAALQRRSHAERLGRLVSLKDMLTQAKAPQAQIDAVNRAIAEEQEDYEARVATLRRWLQAAPAVPGGRLPADTLSREMNSELRDLGRAIGSMNQTFVVPPIRSRHATAGGSHFVDGEDAPEVLPQRVVPGARPPLDAKPRADR